MNDAHDTSRFDWGQSADRFQQDPASPPIGSGAKATSAASAAGAPIDLEQARNFLTALAPGETHFTFQTFDDSEAKQPKLARVMHGSLVEWLPELARLSTLGAGMFVTVNRTDLRGRRETNIVAVRALVADLDDAPLSVLERFGLPPHIIVISSPSRFHVYWKVKDIERTEFTDLQKRLAALLGGDPSVSDLPRVMRLPGSQHQKNPANPHLVWFQAREHSGPYEAKPFRAALAAAERNSVSHKGRADEGVPAARLRRPNGKGERLAGEGGPRPFDEFAPARAPEPWTETGEARLRSALAFIPALDRDTWLKVGFALYDLAAVGPRWPGREMWDEWSRTCQEKFNPVDQEKTWASFGCRDYDGPRITVATIYHLAKEHGWMDRSSTCFDASLVAPKEGIDFSRRLRTDAGNALAFLDLFGDDLKFVEKWRCWIVWDGSRWVEASDIAILPLARRATEEMLKSAIAQPAGNSDRDASIKHAFATQRDARLRAMINLAKGEPRARIEPNVLDANAWLLGCPNGTLDLRTGKLRQARREDFITKQIGVAFDPGATCPRFREFLDWATQGDRERAAFLRALAGYALTGEVCEEQMCVFVGDGDNGKSTLVMTLYDLFGDYAVKVRSDLLVHAQGKEGAPSPDVAALRGMRLAVVSETEDGCLLSEARIKDIVSNEVIAARRLHRDPFTFPPTHKIILSTNHRPHVRGTDHGIWRRLAIVRFNATIAEEAKVADFRERLLRPELPGILNWAVEGLMRWRRDGLGLPGSVRAATAEYRSEMDTVGQWIEERTDPDPEAESTVKTLHSDYVFWLGPPGRHVQPFGARRFSEELERKGYAACKKDGARARRGLKLKPPHSFGSFGSTAHLQVVR